MFDRDCVKTIIDKLSKQYGYFVSEANLQMLFIEEAIKEYNEKNNEKFMFIPEFPTKRSVKGEIKKDEIDLVVVNLKSEKKNKTYIEFKHKIKGQKESSGKTKEVFVPNSTDPFYSFTPSANAGPVDHGRYDCWSDINRLEYYLTNGECEKAYFVFITNMDKYLYDTDKSKYTGFSLKFGDRNGKNHFWYCDKRKIDLIKLTKEKIKKLKQSLGEERLSINETTNGLLTNDYNDELDNFQEFNNDKQLGQYYYLIIEIKKQPQK